MSDALRLVQIGVIGCGKISGIYLQKLATFETTHVRTVADLDYGRACDVAAEHGVDAAASAQELLDDPEVEVVLNLTIPQAHFEVSRAAPRAGKHVYSEKPLALDSSEGEELLALAREKGLRIGCAPDTFLGAGLQTCAEAVASGAIGRPVAAAGFMMSHGVESWHPSPDFFYKRGAGPLFDMGPYYLTAMVALMGPIARVTASAATAFPERTITSKPLAGRTIRVETPTHIAGVLEFASGAVGTLATSFDVWGHTMPPIEIYGTEGTLSVPDPNTFGGTVRLLQAGSKEWRELPVTRPYAANSRGLGLTDMARAIRTGGPHRASGELAHHVLEVMQSLLAAAEGRRYVDIESRCTVPETLDG